MEKVNRVAQFWKANWGLVVVILSVIAFLMEAVLWFYVFPLLSITGNTRMGIIIIVALIWGSLFLVVGGFWEEVRRLKKKSSNKKESNEK